MGGKGAGKGRASGENHSESEDLEVRETDKPKTPSGSESDQGYTGIREAWRSEDSFVYVALRELLMGAGT